MKRFKYLLLIMVATFISVPLVDAESNSDYWCNNDTKVCTYKYLSSTPSGIFNYPEWHDITQLNSSPHKEIIDNLLNTLLNNYNSNLKKDYPYYYVTFYLRLNPNSDYDYDVLDNYFKSTSTIYMTLYAFESIPSLTSSSLKEVCDGDQCREYPLFSLSLSPKSSLSISYNKNIYSDIYTATNPSITTYSLIFSPSNTDISTSYYRYNFYKPLSFYDSNFELINNTGYTLNVPEYNNLSLEPDAQYSSFLSNGSSYTEVNLDNYEYVILSLKDYSQKEAFDTNLKVKGMVGITPVYEYGTVEKTEITDRCNTSYSDYTDYRLYVLKNDLLNNAVYMVKKCENNSSFKFDSTIFNITYVTADNVNDPVITVGGQDYHTIPFDQLSNSANKNEEENFIPGESEGFHPIESLTDYVTSFWNSLSTFMGLVTKFFNTLPIEIRAVCITFFTTACTLGLLKILKH